ncbi:polysaccharide deacetylase family protein [Candidatus Clostridium radicumherbarum]|uniref:Polysaccharide deacetylase family protein n=1 Tax=Candidatus Clostridium radicumherbarum TaxID=3381662 RepID=A0ABW8TQ42_9CLOT
MGKHSRKYVLSAIIFLVILLISSLSFYSIKHSSDKAKAQAAAQAVKEKEAENQRKLYEAKKTEEAKKAEDEKLQAEKIKIEEAIKGEGKSRDIPVLMYHSIAYEKGNELRIPKEKFRLQMKYLKDNGFTTLTLNELYDHLVYGSELPKKPIVITLDDGYVDNYTNALPVLKEFNLKATVFMITSCIDTDNRYLTSNQLQEMDKSGMEIESHTVSHPELNKLSYDVQLSQLKDSKTTLEKVLGREVPYIAYPYGKFNTDTLKIVENLGYKMGFSTITGTASKANGLFKLHRLYVSNKYDMNNFIKLVNISAATNFKS